jgi:two-component system OmpR family response regulator
VTTIADAKTQQTQTAPREIRVLVVDEEAPLTNLLTVALQFEGWRVQTRAYGTEVVAAAQDFAPDAILLDMMLPDINGVEVVERLRENGVTVPVIFLTGRSSLEDRLAAFGAGGDDYITKPFSLEEVTDRLREVFRRSGLLASSRVVADLVLDTETGQVWRAGEAIMVTPLERELLLVLVERSGEPVDGTGLVRALGLGGHTVIDSAAARAVESLREKVNAVAAPLLHVTGGEARLSLEA